jgi:di/tricarboxylate transporter
METSMKVLSWINVLPGLWLLVAAIAFSSGSGPLAGEGVAAVLIIVLACASAVARPHPGISWGVALTGLWAMLVDYALHADPRSHAALVGCAVVVLGAVNAAYRQSRIRV